MAARVAAAAAAACIWRQRRNASLLSISRSNLNLQHSRSSREIAWRTRQVRAMQGTTADVSTAPVKKDEEQTPQNWKIKMLYDGDCPLCMREVNMLMERNKQYGTIKFVDISSDNYSPEENQGLDYETVMGRIHTILSDGTVVTDVEAFRRLYEEVGLGWVYAITKYEPIGKIADAVYDVWAKYRLQITGRPPLEEIVEARRTKKVNTCGNSNACKKV